MDLYAENILDHFRHPRNTGTLPTPTVKHKEFNRACGDAMTVQLCIENDFISALKWQGRGCAISQAAMSMLSEELIGTALNDAVKLSQEDVLALLGVPIGARRLQCALMSLHAVQGALASLKTATSAA